MALKTNVYISDVTNLTEARYYAGMEVAIIGFNANPASDTYMTSTQFDAITSWLSGIQTCWQWNMPLSQDFLTFLSQTPSDFIELTQIPEKEFINLIKKPLLIRTKDPKVYSYMSPELSKLIHGIIWEGPIDNLPELNKLSVYIHSTSSLNTEAFLKQNPNAGIALKGIPESKPGWNDFDQLADLLESLETI